MPLKTHIAVCLFLLLLAASTSAGEPIFDRKPGHPWDELRSAFYARRFSTGDVFDHPHAFEPPWIAFRPFLNDAAFHERVLASLDAVQKLPPAQMEEQPAARRMILFRDLWAVFDGLMWAHNHWFSEREKEIYPKVIARQQDLLLRLARIMHRLELTEDEARALPDAFAIIAQKKLYPKAFDPASVDPKDPLSSGKAFFPTDLFDKDGPWIAYASKEEPAVGGTAHMTSMDNRSVFTTHLRAPQGRAAGEAFLKEYTRTDRRAPVPPGTMLALLRRAVIPTRTGKLVVSPFVESLQLIVAAAPEDRRFKFTLDRAQLLSDGLGLKLLTREDPVDTSSFEAAILWPHPNGPRTHDTDGELYVATKYKTVKEIPSSLANCVKCHDKTSSDIFGRSGPRKAYLQADQAKADATVTAEKETAKGWKTYLQLREMPAK